MESKESMEGGERGNVGKVRTVGKVSAANQKPAERPFSGGHSPQGDGCAAAGLKKVWNARKASKATWAVPSMHGTKISLFTRENSMMPKENFWEPIVSFE